MLLGKLKILRKMKSLEIVVDLMKQEIKMKQKEANELWHIGMNKAHQIGAKFSALISAILIVNDYDSHPPSRI